MQGSPTLGQPMRVICDRDMRRFTSLNLVVKWQAQRAGPMGQRREESPDYSGLFAILNRCTFPSCRKVRAWFTVASPTFTSTAIAIRNPQSSRHAASPPVRGEAMHRVLGRWLWWFKQALQLCADCSDVRGNWPAGLIAHTFNSRSTANECSPHARRHGAGRLNKDVPRRVFTFNSYDNKVLIIRAVCILP